MPDRQGDELFNPAREKWIGADDQPTHSRLDQAGKDTIDLALSACAPYMKFDSEAAGGRLHIFRGDLTTGIGRVEKQADDGRRRDQLVQQLKLFWPQFHVQVGNAPGRFRVSIRPKSTGSPPPA